MPAASTKPPIPAQAASNSPAPKFTETGFSFDLKIEEVLMSLILTCPVSRAPRAFLPATSTFTTIAFRF
jgi:hypothetical protein